MATFFVFLVLICSGGLVHGTDREFGHPLFRTFTAHDYGEAGQIFAVTEDSDGRMLFGCQDAILVFDNNCWGTIPAPGTGYIRSLAIDQHGVVWFSSSTEIGYLSREDGVARLVRVYHGALGQDSRILVADGRLYFVTQTGLLLWKDGFVSRQAWPTDWITPSSATVYRGKIRVCDRDGSIYELNSDSFNKIAEAPSANAGEVRRIVDCPIGDGLIVRSSGIFQKTGATLAPWPTDIDPLLTSSVISDAQWVLGKYLAVLVLNSGVYLLNEEGHLVESFTVTGGLADAGFLAAGEDRDGGFWLCTDTEITRLQCTSRYTEFDHELGLPKGFVGGVVRYRGRIYAATQRGVYVLKAAEAAPESAHFLPFGDRNERFFGITISGSTAYVFSDSATYSLNLASSSLDRIGPGAASVYTSRIDPKRLFLSTRNGLESVYDTNGLSFLEGRLARLPDSILGLGEGEQGDLIVGTETNGFYSVHLQDGAGSLFHDARIEPLLDGQNKKVLSGSGAFFKWQGQMVLVGADRVWKLIPGQHHLEPFELAAKSLPGRRINAIYPSRLTEDYVWVISRAPDAGAETGFEVGKLYAVGRYEPLSHAVSYPLGVINSVWDENVAGEPVVWIAGDYGVMRVLLDLPSFTQRKFEVYLSQILTADGAPISVHGSKELTLKYDERDFKIQFGTDRFSVGNELYYQARLEGKVEHRFSPTVAAVWRSGALNEGHYLLRVRARDTNGVESKELTFAFTIIPPWYRSIWMEIVSGLLIILAIYLFNRWRTWQMRLRERELVRIVNLRTRELRENEIQLRHAKDAAEHAREHAEMASRAKTVFLANMSHELRTPINSILGYAQLLLRRRYASDDGRAKLRTILTSGEHLLEMINEVLDLSRVESGKVSVAMESLELPKFIVGIVDEFQLRAAHGSLRFIHEIQGDLPQWIETDPLRLRQVLNNLLGNAVKFTTHGEIAFRVYVTAERLRFEVQDTGKGIPQEDLPSILKPFHQASNNELIGQGVGLGLHISKQIVEMLGGQITIDSELGRGSTFSFEIPRLDANPIDPDPPSPQIIGYEGPRRKILVVDDEPLNRLMLRELLSTVGFCTEAAESTELALCLVKDCFDVVISDIRMPGCDGHSFCRQLRSRRETKDLITIASSASVFADDQRLALASGFNDFLPKPVMEEELFEILRRHLGVKWVYAEPTESAER